MQLKNINVKINLTGSAGIPACAVRGQAGMPVLPLSTM